MRRGSTSEVLEFFPIGAQAESQNLQPPREATKDILHKKKEKQKILPLRNTDPFTPYTRGSPTCLHLEITWEASKNTDAGILPTDCDLEAPRGPDVQTSLGTTTLRLFFSHQVKTTCCEVAWRSQHCRCSITGQLTAVIKQQREPNLIVNPLAFPPFSLPP